MPVQDHPAYEEELGRLEYTLGYVEKTLEISSRKKDNIDRELERIKKHFNSDNSQDYIDMMVNTTLQGSLSLKLRNLLTARSKPYFARVDFVEKDRDKAENLYIGKMCLMRDEDQEIIIVDWRAPVANLYYESRLGETGYLCPEGYINGDLALKRQFTINGGRLEEMFDIDITTNDEFLQSCLGANADSRLKEIVSTIQFEQNRIIRADMWTPLLVHGVAGSGKTTIALHRIAYLAYTHEKSFNPESFMIIAPNRFFLNYISEVLPELGVEKVRQTTYEEFATEVIRKRLKIRDANEKMIRFVNGAVSKEQAKQNEMLRKTSQLKASMLFKEALDDYISAVEQIFIPLRDFRIGSKVIYEYQEINRLFLVEYRKWPILRRVKEIKKYLANRLEREKDILTNRILLEYEEKIRNIKAEIEDAEQRQWLAARTLNERDIAIKEVLKEAKQAVNEYIGQMLKLDPIQCYKEFINSRTLFEGIMEGRTDTELARFAREYTADVLKSGYVEVEDLAPIMYLKLKIYGMDEKIPVRHIVIDEVQDFSIFQLYTLKHIIKDSSFTMLGDLCQGIHSYRGIKDWDDILRYVFDGKGTFLTLEQSYRTTVEIIEAGNKVIGRMEPKGFITAKPVIRRGGSVVIAGKRDMEEIAREILERIREFEASSFNTLAVICKTLEECTAVYSHIKKESADACMITGKESVYRGGIMVVPSYLAKGLEFDVVIIANANSDTYRVNELDAKLLYVAMTRPLHRLYIYYSEQMSPLLEGV